MDSKRLAKIDSLLDKADHLLARLAGAMAYASTRGPPQLREQVRSATVQYMSGRWHRRSGDVYGIDVQAPGVKDAYGPPGDLRPPDQR